MDIPASLQYASKLHRSGKLEKAKKIYIKVLKLDPDNFDALQLLGAVELQRKEYGVAAKHLERAIASRENSPNIHCNLGAAYEALNQFELSETCFNRAIELDPGFVQAHYNLGGLLKRRGRTEEALAHYVASEQLRPGHTETLMNIGIILYETMRMDEAEGCFRRVLLESPKHTLANVYLGYVYQQRADYDGAAVHYRKALESAPNSALAWGKLADALESSGQIDEASRTVTTALERHPHDPLLKLVAARLERRKGNWVEVERLLNPHLETLEETDVMAAIHTEMGIALDRQNQCDSAFAAFARANDIMASLPSAKAIDSGIFRREIQRYQEWVDRDRVPNWSSGTFGGTTPIFLVGFPRSGTTLTEQIIGAHPHLMTGDELPIVSDLIENAPYILKRDIEFPKDLDGVGPDEIGLLRADYWRRLEEQVGPAVMSMRFIDKLPLNIVYLGFIKRIFPDAKVIVLLRDPRDVCLSCFMQLFSLNSAMKPFLDLEETAELYAEVMGLWVHYRHTLGLDFIEVQYERIVADFEGTVGDVLSFLDERWDDRMSAYSTAAAGRSISTPSYQDVSQPLYHRAIGRWQKYRDHLEPVLPTLAPFVELFGYRV